MSSEDDNVLYVREEDENPYDDVWDDSALIKAYDKAISLAKDEVIKRLDLEEGKNGTKPKKPQSQKHNRQSQKTQKTQKKWVNGSPCRAIYSEDGHLYEAVILKIHENTGSCTVKFIGYNNKEKVELSSLLESEGLQSQIAQEKEAEAAAAAAETVTEEQNHTMDFEETPKLNGPDSSVKGFSIPMDVGSSEAKSFKNMFSAAGPAFNHITDTMPPAPPLPPQLMAQLPENDADALSSMLMSWYMSGFHTGYYHGLKQAQRNYERRKK